MTCRTLKKKIQFQNDNSQKMCYHTVIAEKKVRNRKKCLPKIMFVVDFVILIQYIGIS